MGRLAHEGKHFVNFLNMDLNHILWSSILLTLLVGLPSLAVAQGKAIIYSLLLQ